MLILHFVGPTIIEKHDRRARRDCPSPLSMAFLPRSSTCAVSQTMTNRRSRWRASFSASPGCNRRMAAAYVPRRKTRAATGARLRAYVTQHQRLLSPLVAAAGICMPACLRAFDPEGRGARCCTQRGKRWQNTSTRRRGIVVKPQV